MMLSPRCFRAAFAILAAVLASGAPLHAQNVLPAVTGTVREDDSGQPAVQAAVLLLSPRDSSIVEGTVTGSGGRFAISASAGDYILKVSSMGFADQFRDIHLTVARNGLDVGVIPLVPDAVMLESAIVQAKAEPVTVQGDTVVYNAAAYNVAEDASLEDLIKKIPGLEFDEDGNVLIAGRQITQLLVNGKLFFGGDVKTGLKNLSIDMIENIRTYEKESDNARLTGVDDGESEPVIDVSVKKSMLDNWKGNANAAYGSSSRFLTRLNANKISDKQQQTVIAGARNTGGKAGISTTNRNQVGNGATGNTDRWDAGYSFARDTDKSKTGGHIQYNGTYRDASSVTRSQSILSSGSSFSDGTGWTGALTHTVKGDYSLEWRINDNNTVIFKPVFSYNYRRNLSTSGSTSYNDDPYLVDDPSGLRVNSTDNGSELYERKWNGSASLQWTHRFAKKGRNISFRVYESITTTDSDQYNDYKTRYYRIKKNPDSTLVRHQYADQYYSYWSTQAQVTYNEPLGNGLYLQGVYRVDYKYNTQDRGLYTGTPPVRSDQLSSSGSYRYIAHTGILNFRIVRKKYNLTVGMTAKPQTTLLSYPEAGRTETIRTGICNFAPLVILKYKKSKTDQLTFQYRSWAGQPSLYNLLPVTGGTNPLSVHYGNPDLKPSFTQDISLSYNTSNRERKSSFICNASYNMVSNASSNSTTYDEDTGGRVILPKNIDGNWKALGSLSYNKTFPGGRFSVSEHASAEYQNNVSYLYNKKLKADETNVVRRFMVKEMLNASYRGEWAELVLSGGFDFTDENSLLRPQMNQRPYSFTGGVSTVVTMPWKMRLSADYSLLCQRGYSYDELNCNYHILNAGIAQPLFNKKATLKLDLYDVLGRQDNLTRTFTAERRSISTYNGVCRYIIATFIYRFNFTKK